MNKYLLILFILPGFIISSCKENLPTDEPEESLTYRQSTSEKIVFSKPTLVIINSDSVTYTIHNSKKIQPFILSANSNNLEIAIISIRPILFKCDKGKEISVESESINQEQLIFFNGNQILISYSEDTSPAEMISFITKRKKAGKAILNEVGNKDKFVTYNKKLGVDYPKEHIGVTIPKLLTKNKIHNLNTNDFNINPIISRNPYLSSYISNLREFGVAIENDMFNNVDRYYTNGIIIRYNNPSFAFWKINSILPVSETQSIEYNSIEILHAMYTPITTKTPPRLDNDRPYSSTLIVRFERRSENPSKELIQTASVDIGVIGQAALGSLMQKGVHATLPTNNEPLGWETQIANDLIINYNYSFTRSLISENILHLYANTGGSVGTLKTCLSTGIGFRIGPDKYFLVPLPESFYELNTNKGKKLRISFQSSLTTSIVGYNATLCGGLLNKNNVYVLKPNELERMIFNAEAVFSVSYSKYGINLAQHYLSKEFKAGKSHYWGQIGLNFQL